MLAGDRQVLLVGCTLKVCQFFANLVLVRLLPGILEALEEFLAFAAEVLFNSVDLLGNAFLCRLGWRRRRVLPGLVGSPCQGRRAKHKDIAYQESFHGGLLVDGPFGTRT